MKYLVFGSRTFKDYKLMERELGILVDSGDEIISGGAEGADSCVELFCREHGIKLTRILPDYNKLGVKAPLVRNALMADAADEGICFYDGFTTGTIHTIQMLARRGKHCEVFGFKKVTQ